MGKGEPDPGVEFVDDDPPRPDGPEALGPRRPRRVPRRLRVLILAGAALAAATLLTLRETGVGRPAASPTAATPPPASPPRTAAGHPATGGAITTVRVVDAGHPLLGGGNWELFGLGPGVVVRIQPELGRVTATPIPALMSSGPVSFVVTDAGAIVRPVDVVPGYRVPDGADPVALTAPFDSGPLFPGPDGHLVWTAGADSDPDSDPPSLVLLPPDGGPVPGLPQEIALPAGSSPLAANPDGAGYVMVAGVGGTYDATPDGLRRITTGSVLAGGRTGWLVDECDDRHRCSLALVDRADWSRHPVAVSAAGIDPDRTGLLAPDGAFAAVFATSAAGAGSRLVVLDLATRSTTRVTLSGAASPEPGTLAWSPDGRWLFVLHGTGRLAAVDPRTGEVADLGVPLPPLTRLALRGGE
ncbi:MAG: hypothetical protein EPN43_06605 [Jatrophihabitans sp.]|nr:MAG: hypothetical protein EPN43_06605 [Jatrophihabitans sp.]